MNRKKSDILLAFICLFNFSFFYLCHSMDDEEEGEIPCKLWRIDRVWCGGPQLAPACPREFVLTGEETDQVCIDMSSYGAEGVSQPLLETSSGEGCDKGKLLLLRVRKVDLRSLEMEFLGSDAICHLRKFYENYHKDQRVGGDFFIFQLSNENLRPLKIDIRRLFLQFQCQQQQLVDLFEAIESRWWGWAKLLGGYLSGAVSSLGYNVINLYCESVPWEGMCYNGGNIVIFSIGLACYWLFFGGLRNIRENRQSHQRIFELFNYPSEVIISSGGTLTILFFLPSEVSGVFQSQVTQSRFEVFSST
jgi:hypothetical protein